MKSATFICVSNAAVMSAGGSHDHMRVSSQPVHGHGNKPEHSARCAVSKNAASFTPKTLLLLTSV